MSVYNLELVGYTFLSTIITQVTSHKRVMRYLVMN